ncbi:class I SAM-dependent methyltransferase [Chloroflexota bacterium]
MTEASCPLCKSNESRYCFSERGYKLLSCNTCDLFYIDPYPENVHEHVQKYDYDNLEILNPNRHYQTEIQLQKMYFELIAQELDEATTLLDVGCGTGHFLERLQNYPNLYRAGIELNKDRAAMARKKAGCDIFQIPIEEFNVEVRFDVVTMTNVLSHIPDFERLFGKLRAILTPHGKLILKVGEMKKNVAKSDVFDWQIPDHLHFLGLNTIDYICQDFNFKIRKHRRIPLSQDMFSPVYFKSPGRSKIRNIIKNLLVYTPFALPTLAKIYDIRTGQRIYSSFIVLEMVP